MTLLHFFPPLHNFYFSILLYKRDQRRKENRTFLAFILPESLVTPCPDLSFCCCLWLLGSLKRCRNQTSKTSQSTNTIWFRLILNGSLSYLPLYLQCPAWYLEYSKVATLTPNGSSSHISHLFNLTLLSSLDSTP